MMGNNAGRVIFKDVFIYFIAAFILCFASVLFITFYSYTSIYNQAIKESISSTTNALSTEKQRFSTVVSSYANWNLSFQNIVTNYSLQWVKDNIVDDLKNNFSVNIIGIYNDNGNLSVQYSTEEDFGINGRSAPEEITKLITAYRNDVVNQKSQSYFCEISGQVYLLGISRINGRSLNVTATNSGAFIVAAKRVNEYFLQELSTSYNLVSLNFVSLDQINKLDNLPRVPILFGEEVLGYIAWLPQDSAKQILFVLIPMGIVLIVVLCLIGFLISRHIIKTASGYENMINELMISASNAAKSKMSSDQMAKVREQMLLLMGSQMQLPVNGLMGIITLLKQTELTEAQISYVNTMEASSESLLNLVDSILDFSKIELGEISMSFSDINIRIMMDEIFALLRPVAIQKSLTFDYYFSDDVPLLVRANAVRLRQIIIHLVTNALKFTKVGSVKVNVTAVSLPNNRAEIGIQVVDTGIGIPESLKAALFDDYFQLNSETDSAKKQNFGVGLTMVKTLVDNMQGKLGVESKVGQGSSFWVCLEVDCVLKYQPAPENKRKPRIGQNLNVLMLDEESIDHSLTHSLLEKAVKSITVAGSSDEAAKLINKNQYDAIFINALQDYNTIAKVLREAMKDAKIPIVGILGAEIEENYQPDIFDHVIVSPVTSKKIENFLGQI